MIRQGLQTRHVRYPNQSNDAVISPPSNQQILIHSICAYNGIIADNNIAIGHSLNNNNWALWQIGASVTNQSAVIQAGTALNIYDTTNNHGWIVQAKARFGLLSLVISQAQTGSPVYTYEYWNGASWATLVLQNTPDYSATGVQVILFDAPLDWVVGAGSLGPSEVMYSIRMRATTAPTLAVQINSLKVCKLLTYRAKIAPYAQLEASFGSLRPLLQQGEDILAFFAFPSNSNTMEVSYQISP